MSERSIISDVSPEIFRLQEGAAIETHPDNFKDASAALQAESTIDSPDAAEDGKKAEDSGEREAAILALATRYAHHREVTVGLHALQKAYPRGAPLDADQEAQLFRTIDEGLAVFSSLPDANTPSSQEEKALIDLVAARQFICVAHDGLVWGAARRYANPELLPFVDAVQEGYIGLSRAIGKFDLHLGPRFATHATWWIYQAIMRAQASTSRPIRLPDHAHLQWSKLQRCSRELGEKFQRWPTLTEIATSTGLSPDKVWLLWRAGYPQLISLDEPISSRSEDTVGSNLPDPNLDEHIFTTRLAAMLAVRSLFQSAELTDKEKLVLGLRHEVYQAIPQATKLHRGQLSRPLDYTESMSKQKTPDELSFRIIATMMDMSKAGVEKLYKQAVVKARMILEAQDDD